MEFPYVLRETIEQLTSHFSLAELKKVSASLTERYKNKSGQGKRLVSEDIEVLVYAAVRMPATFAAVCECLASAKAAVDPEIHTVLDIGTGTGAALWAADAVFAPDGFTCLEREKAMLRLGKQLAAKGSSALSGAVWLDTELNDHSVSHLHADLVTASYVLNELPEDKRCRMVGTLWSCADKMLAIIEPGTPEGFRQLQIARQQLIDAGAFIAAPCLHNQPCALTGEDWCHFTARVQRSGLHKQLKDGDAPYEDEKYSYLIAVRESPVYNGARVLRHPITEKGRVTLRLCTDSGIRDVMVTKKEKEIYKAARKVKCGGILTGKL